MYLSIFRVDQDNVNSSNPASLQSIPGLFGIQNGADYLPRTNSLSLTNTENFLSHNPFKSLHAEVTGT